MNKNEVVEVKTGFGTRVKGFVKKHGTKIATATAGFVAGVLVESFCENRRWQSLDVIDVVSEDTIDVSTDDSEEA